MFSKLQVTPWLIGVPDSRKSTWIISMSQKNWPFYWSLGFEFCFVGEALWYYSMDCHFISGYMMSLCFISCPNPYLDSRSMTTGKVRLTGKFQLLTLSGLLPVCNKPILPKSFNVEKKSMWPTCSCEISTCIAISLWMIILNQFTFLLWNSSVAALFLIVQISYSWFTIFKYTQLHRPTGLA